MEIEGLGAPEAKRSRNAMLYILVGSLVLHGLSGIVGRIGLIRDPTGASLIRPVGFAARLVGRKEE